MTSTTPGGAQGIPPGVRPVSYQPVEALSNAYAGLGERGRLVVRDTAAWRRVLSQRTGPMLEDAALPTVDFGKSMVVIAALGQRSSTGFRVSIEGVYEQEGRLYVDVLTVTPGRDCLLASVMTAPMAAAMLAARDGPVTFVEREEVSPCR